MHTRLETSLRLRTDDLFFGGRAPRDVNDEACDEPSQIEASIESIGKSGKGNCRQSIIRYSKNYSLTVNII